MRKFIFSLLFFPVTLFCQTADSLKGRKMEIGFSFSPDFCYRSLLADDAGKTIAEIRDTLEIPKMGYTTGLNFTYKIGNKLVLASGILFSDKGEKTKKYSLVENISAIPLEGRIATKNSLIDHYYYLDIPVKANYYILNKRFGMYLTAGVSANIFLFQNTTSTLEYNDGFKEENKLKGNSGLSKVNLALLAGFGIDFTLSNKFNLKVEPIYRHSISPIIDAPIKNYLFSTGIGIGLYYIL